MKEPVTPLVIFAGAPAVTVAAPAPTQEIDYTACPSCGSKRHRRNLPGLPAGVRVCTKCDAIFGRCYLGDSYGIVLPLWAKEGSYDPEGVRYYDFLTTGSAGQERRHGWYDPASKRITQTG
jgi:hypothetical protein